jgi:hypothetical protein
MARLILIVTAAVTTAVGVLFLVVGLDVGDKLASIVGAVAAVSGLGLTIHQASVRRNPPPEQQRAKYVVSVTHSSGVTIGDGK